jgi:hypothetical protein
MGISFLFCGFWEVRWLEVIGDSVFSSVTPGWLWAWASFG